MDDYRECIDYLESSKCDQKQGDNHQELHNYVIDTAIKAIEKQAFFENEVGEIRDWFVDNKDCLLDTAKKVAKDDFIESSVDDLIDEINLDFIVENIVDEIQKGILNVLDTFKDN